MLYECTTRTLTIDTTAAWKKLRFILSVNVQILKKLSLKKIHNEALSTKEERWNHFDEEYGFKLMKFMSERIKAVIKVLIRFFVSEFNNSYLNIEQYHNIFPSMSWKNYTNNLKELYQ